jgi:hypothetical protein
MEAQVTKYNERKRSYALVIDGENHNQITKNNTVSSWIYAGKSMYKVCQKENEIIQCM